MFLEGTAAENALLLQLAAAWNAGTIPTNASIASTMNALNASWTSAPQVFTVELDGSGILNISRRAKINYILAAPAGLVATDDFTGITETLAFQDGDLLVLGVKEGHQIDCTFLSPVLRLSEAGQFAVFVRFYGAWGLLGTNGTYPANRNAVDVQTETISSAATSFTVTSPMVALSAISGGTAASAVYEVLTVTDPTDSITIYVDGIQIGTATGAASVDDMGNSLETSIDAGTDFTSTYNSGTNQITITDALNLGAAGNSLFLSDLALGATGTIVSQFSGGVNGTEAAVTLDTINGIGIGVEVKIYNAMTAEDITFDVGGNLVGSTLPLTVGPGDFATLISFDGVNVSVK